MPTQPKKNYMSNPIWKFLLNRLSGLSWMCVCVRVLLSELVASIEWGHK